MPTPSGRNLDGADLDERDASCQTPLLTEPSKKPVSASKRIFLLLQDWWLWEIVSAGTAVLAFAVIVVILVLFNQSSLPDWPSVFTVRSVMNLGCDLLLKSCIDKFSHLLVCNSSEAFYHFGCWSLDIAIKMVMVPSGRASPSEGPSAF